MLNVYGINQSDKWDDIVKSFEQYDVYYLSGYVKAFKIHGDGEPLLLYYESKSVRGINVAMKRDVADDDRFSDSINRGEYYDITTPYGYGGWYFEGEQKDKIEFIKEYEEWCNNNHIICEFVRFHPVLENAIHPFNELYNREMLGNTVAIELDDDDAIWERFSSSNRRHIRVSDKEGVLIRTGTSKEDFDVFREIYETTMNNDNATDYYYFDKDFFESIRNDLDGYYTLFTAYLDDKPIASSIMIYADKLMNYHLSGQVFEYRRYAGTNKLLYEAAKWGRDKGYDWLHLGGGLGAQEGPLYDFKKSFYKKGDDKQFYVGRKVFNQEKYDYLVGLRDGELSAKFFPIYRG